MAKKILIADDNADLIRILSLQLKNAGYSTVTAVNGKEAVEFARTQLPDLILMDVMMPVMNGLEATRLIRQDPETRSIPIIAVTAKITPQDQKELLNEGCDDYLSKPYTTKELTSCIDKLLQQGKS